MLARNRFTAPTLSWISLAAKVSELKWLSTSYVFEAKKGRIIPMGKAVRYVTSANGRAAIIPNATTRNALPLADCLRILSLRYGRSVACPA